MITGTLIYVKDSKIVARILLETFNVGLALSESFYCDPPGYNVVIALVDDQVKIVANFQETQGTYTVTSNYDIQTNRLSGEGFDLIESLLKRNRIRIN